MHRIPHPVLKSIILLVALILLGNPFASSAQASSHPATVQTETETLKKPVKTEPGRTLQQAFETLTKAMFKYERGISGGVKLLYGLIEIPPSVGLSERKNEKIVCRVCSADIKPGEPVLRCSCGTGYHPSCARLSEQCLLCGETFTKEHERDAEKATDDRVVFRVDEDPESVENGEDAIPEETKKSDYYEILEVPSSASREDIRKAYKQKMREYHPDRVQTLGKKLLKLAEEEAKMINRAHQVLMDEKARAEYDGEMGYNGPRIADRDTGE